MGDGVGYHSSFINTVKCMHVNVSLMYHSTDLSANQSVCFLTSGPWWNRSWNKGLISWWTAMRFQEWLLPVPSLWVLMLYFNVTLTFTGSIKKCVGVRMFIYTTIQKFGVSKISVLNWEFYIFYQIVLVTLRLCYKIIIFYVTIFNFLFIK